MVFLVPLICICDASVLEKRGWSGEEGLGYSDISNNRLNRILSEGQEGREKGREHQNHEIIFYDFSITIALIETLIGLN
jgi:hypothetical protein